LAQSYRYKRVSTLAQRQQTKWVVFGTVAALGGYGAFTALDLLLQSALLASLLGNTAFFVLMLLIPISIAVAVLRYRLYDIDVVINRTLVYGALTVVLAGTFQAIDGALHYLLVTLAHLHSLPGSIIAALVVGVLFNPVRHRIQHFVDKHTPSELDGRPRRPEEADSS
jgi:hypothetical protein